MIDEAYGCEDSTPESEAVATIFDELHSGCHEEPGKMEDKIITIVENLARDLQEATSFLQGALARLPPDPVCNCGGVGGDWDENHANSCPLVGDIGEPTQRQEIANFLNRMKERKI
jgi:hypothetical protein